MAESNFQTRKDEKFDDCTTIGSSVSSNKSFRQRLRDRFVFSNSNSHEIGQKAMELKMEFLESELQSKVKEIEKLTFRSFHEIRKNKELKYKLKEKEKEWNEVRIQLFNDEDVFSIKSLLESQKDSIIKTCIEMFDRKEDFPVVIKAGMQINDRKIMSEITIHKEEIAVANSQSNVIRSKIDQKDVHGAHEKMQKEVLEELKTKLQLKDKKIQDQQVKIGTISQDATPISQYLRISYMEIKALKAQLEYERQISRNLRSEIEKNDLEGELRRLQKVNLRSQAQLKQERFLEIDFLKAQLEQERQNDTSICQDLQMSYLEIETLNAQLKHEKNILKNSCTKYSEVVYDIKSEIGQKEIKGYLGKMQRKVEDLETELQFKNKEIEDQQVKIDSISLTSIRQDLRKSYLKIEALNTQLELERNILKNSSTKSLEIEDDKYQISLENK
jgi:hypothetical protein